MDVVHGGPLEPHRGGILTDRAREAWIAGLIGRSPNRPELFVQALTHGSASPRNYERLEFLGDRVLGLVIGEWLLEVYPTQPEGELSTRLNQIVSGEACAAIARDAGIQPHMILGKQARDDGAIESVNVLGDMMEAVIGALFLDAGLDEARKLVRRLWQSKIECVHSGRKHPKSELQEWAAAHRRKAPDYVLVERSGPAHSPVFTVSVSIRSVGEATATGASKQEAETEAARQLLERIS